MIHFNGDLLILCLNEMITIDKIRATESQLSATKYLTTAIKAEILASFFNDIYTKI